MELPKDFTMRNVLHGNKGQGGYVYRYQDAQGFGVTLVAERQTRKHAETQTFTCVWCPGHEFKTFVELRDYLLTVPQEVIDAEKAKHPFIRGREPYADGQCRICRKNSTTHVTVAMSPDTMDDWFFTFLCAEHSALLETPKELVAALQAERAARGTRQQSRLDEDVYFDEI